LPPTTEESLTSARDGISGSHESNDNAGPADGSSISGVAPRLPRCPSPPWRHPFHLRLFHVLCRLQHLVLLLVLLVVLLALLLLLLLLLWPDGRALTYKYSFIFSVSIFASSGFGDNLGFKLRMSRIKHETRPRAAANRAAAAK
jgi:hypothetical protein